MATNTEITATFTAETGDFTRGTTRAARDLAKVAVGADEATNQTDDLSTAISQLAREFSKGARDAIGEARALARAGDEAKRAQDQVDALTGEARALHRELKRVDGMNVEPDIKVGKIRGALAGLHAGFGKLAAPIGAIGGAIPAVGGGIEKIAVVAPEATIALAGLAAAVAAFALPLALAAGAAVGAGAAIAALSLLTKDAPGAGPMRDAWARVATVFGELVGTIRTYFVPVMVDIAQAVAPAVAAALENLNTWFQTNAQTVATFLINLTKLGLQGVVAMAHLGQGILGALGPAFAWMIRTIGVVARGMAGAIRGMGVLFPPLRNQFNQAADDLTGIADAAGPVADSVQSTAAAGVTALGLLADSAANAKQHMDELAGVYKITVQTKVVGDFRPGRLVGGPSGIAGHPTAAGLTGPRPAVPAVAAAPAVNLTAPAARSAGPVVNIDARGAVGLDRDKLAKVVVAALERYEGQNGARWRAQTNRWRIA